MKKPPAPAKAVQTPVHSTTRCRPKTQEEPNPRVTKFPGVNSRTVQQISPALGGETPRGNSSPEMPKVGVTEVQTEESAGNLSELHSSPTSLHEPKHELLQVLVAQRLCSDTLDCKRLQYCN